MRKKYLYFVILCIHLPLTNVKAQQTLDKNWTIIAKDTLKYKGVAMANGRIGIVSSPEPGKTTTIILNHIFDRTSPYGVSKLLEGINFANIEIIANQDTLNLDNCTLWEQKLDMKKGILTTSCRFKDYANINISLYALRHLPYSGLVNIHISPIQKPLTIKVSGEINCPKAYQDITTEYKTLVDLENRIPLIQTIAYSPFEKHQIATSAGFIFNNDAPPLTHIEENRFTHKLQFIKTLDTDYQVAWTGAVCTSCNFNNPVTESERMLVFLQLEPKEQNIKKHINRWKSLWQSDIVIEGDNQAQKDIRLAIYQMYSSIRKGTDLSIPPMGLSALGYNGHIFWDAELWILPPLLLLQPSFAKSMLNYRYDRLGKAKEKAANFGYAGAMFPWESDDTGEEATPTWALTGTFEHHITADIGIAVWNYFSVTKDTLWLKEKGYPMLKSIADFWTSRVTLNKDNSYSINNVVGANEYYHNADDNAFTNGAVKTCLEYTVKAAVALAETPQNHWQEIAERLRFYTFENGVIKENKNYKGEAIKQVDVNLLSYPLALITDKNEIRKNSNYYQKRIVKDGPAMSHSILATLYARLGETEEAYKLFTKAYAPNKRPPFGLLSESATSNNPYFITAAGGLLQAVLFGFGGLEITDNGIIQREPHLPKKWKKLIIKNIGIEKNTFLITNDNEYNQTENKIR